MKLIIRSNMRDIVDFHLFYGSPTGRAGRGRKLSAVWNSEKFIIRFDDYSGDGHPILNSNRTFYFKHGEFCGFRVVMAIIQFVASFRIKSASNIEQCWDLELFSNTKAVCN